MKAYQISPEILSEDDHGLLDNATALLEARVNQHPDNAESHFQLAELLVLMGLLSEAAINYQKVIDISPNGPLALLSKGELDKIKKRIETQKKAEQQITKKEEKQTREKQQNTKTSQNSTLVERLKQQVASLQKEVAQLQKQLREARKTTAEKIKHYKQMEEDYKKLQKDSRVWHLSYIKDVTR
jgi:tetratricopeptide (TPR) repeat protein